MARNKTASASTSGPSFDQQYAAAVESGKQAVRARSVGFEREARRLCIELADGVLFAIPVRLLQGLGSASDEELEEAELLADGYAVHWPALDVDFTIGGLLSGYYGNRKWMEQMQSRFLAAAGRKGGRASTHAKQAAARANGKLGGRPRKKVAEQRKVEAA